MGSGHPEKTLVPFGLGLGAVVGLLWALRWARPDLVPETALRALTGLAALPVFAALMLTLGVGVWFAYDALRYPLVTAAALGWRGAAEYLLDRGAHPDQEALGGRTPLLAAVDRGDLELARLLLSRRADPMKPDRPHSPSALEQAVWKGRTEIVAAMLDAGAPIGHAWPNGRTLLHMAAAAGHADLARLLVERGARLDALDSWRHTPLEVAEGEAKRWLSGPAS